MHYGYGHIIIICMIIIIIPLRVRACVRACVPVCSLHCVSICGCSLLLVTLSMQVQQVLALVATLLLSGALAAAPGDETSFCQGSYPDTKRVLMDSTRYADLLKNRGRGMPWSEYDVDKDGNSVKVMNCAFNTYPIYSHTINIDMWRALILL